MKDSPLDDFDEEIAATMKHIEEMDRRSHWITCVVCRARDICTCYEVKTCPHLCEECGA